MTSPKDAENTARETNGGGHGVLRSTERFHTLRIFCLVQLSVGFPPIGPHTPPSGIFGGLGVEPHLYLGCFLDQPTDK